MKLANKDLVILGFIIALLTSMVYVYTLPTAFAAELNVQDKTISVLNDVMGLKTDLYAINQSAQNSLCCLQISVLCSPSSKIPSLLVSIG